MEDEDLRFESVSHMRRDGTLWIGNAANVYPIKNFRWNGNPVTMLKNVETRGRLVRMGGTLVPLLKVKEFRFSSLSDDI